MQIGEWPTSIAYAKSVGSGLLMTEVTSVRRYVIKLLAFADAFGAFTTLATFAAATLLMREKNRLYS